MSVKPCHISVFEHQTLKVGQEYNHVEFEEKHRQALEVHHGKKVDYFRLIHNGVQLNEFVGVLQVGGLVIEVLPKADRNSDTLHWRKVLINMLRSVGIFDIQAPSSSSLNIKQNYILDLYFSYFLKEVEYLFNAGLIKNYRKVEENQNALKGALKFDKHISKNLVHKERFFTRHTAYDQNHTVNQIIRKTLRLLVRINTDVTVQSRVSSLLLRFPELDDIQVSRSTFDQISYHRKNEGYRNAIEISRLLLLNYHPDLSKGQNHVLALMFDMNLLWERFVYLSLKKMVPREV